MFAKPRPKKSPLPPPNKKRKSTSAVEEVNFDFDARQEYLTGFHKRKLQRIKNAQEENAKKARLEKIEMRKQIRDERKRDMEEHVRTVNKLLHDSQVAGGVEEDSDEESVEEWDGFADQPNLDIVDHEEEYIDEDRYTTVTVESVSVSRDGLFKPQLPSADDEGETKAKIDTQPNKADDADRDRQKKKKKKFRYESKIDRKLTTIKQKIKSKGRRRD